MGCRHDALRARLDHDEHLGLPGPARRCVGDAAPQIHDGLAVDDHADRSAELTENTLYPLALSLTDRSWLPKTARLWGIVFTANVIGTALFAVIAMKTGALSAEIGRELSRLGDEAPRARGSAAGGAGLTAAWRAFLQRAARAADGRLAMSDETSARAAATVCVVGATAAVLTTALGAPVGVYVALMVVVLPLLMYFSRNMDDDDPG